MIEAIVPLIFVAFAIMIAAVSRSSRVSYWRNPFVMRIMMWSLVVSFLLTAGALGLTALEGHESGQGSEDRVRNAVVGGVLATGLLGVALLSFKNAPHIYDDFHPGKPDKFGSALSEVTLRGTSVLALAMAHAELAWTGFGIT